MKLFFVLFIAMTSLTLSAKTKEQKRKVANDNINVNADAVVNALQASGLLSNSTAMANQFSQSTKQGYNCSGPVEKSEIKSVKLLHKYDYATIYKFVGEKMCFDSKGPGVVQFKYDGEVWLRDDLLSVAAFNLKLELESAD